MEKEFVKYKERGSMHWREMTSRSLRVFNANQQARYGWIMKSVGDIRDKKILDLGCGDGCLSYCMAQRGAQVIGIDNERLGIELAQHNLHSTSIKSRCTFIVGSAYELPFPDNSFDHVVSCEVIEHVQFPERMIAEARRVLRPGGKFVLTTPYRTAEFPTDPNHVQEFFPTQLHKMLGVSFSNVEIKLTHHIFWFGIYTYTVRPFKRRQPGRWFVNMLTLWFGYNPFMIDYPEPTKFDRFVQILAIAQN
jgi:ubiquinone biosynthesis O-methyltransferase